MNSGRQPIVIFVRVVFDSMYRALNERMGTSVSASGSGLQMVTPAKSRYETGSVVQPIRGDHSTFCGDTIVFAQFPLPLR